jgi:flagellar hook-associated protein 3 FlgL
MVSNINPDAQRYLLDLQRVQKTIAKASQEVSSGLRVSKPSDDPDEVSSILQLYARLARNTQIKSNLIRVQAEVGTASETLATATKIIDRARVLLSQGAGTNQTTESRATLAVEVQSLLEELVTASRTIAEGRYVFSGDQNQDPSYEVNLANPNGIERLLTASASRVIQHPGGSTYSASLTAQQIFDSRNSDDSLAADNVFAAVNNARLALANNDQAAIDSALASLRLAGDHLNNALSFYGTVEQETDSAIDFSNKLEVQLRTELGSRRDADLVESIMKLEQGKLQEEAAYASQAHMPKNSLFDYLA